MTESSRSSVDPVTELRLRRWARAYYVPAEQRSADWHPIVLEEMMSKDVEQNETTDWNEQDSKASSFVPLPPTGVYYVHPAHEACGDPKVLGQLVDSKPLEVGHANI